MILISDIDPAADTIAVPIATFNPPPYVLFPLVFAILTVAPE